MPCTEPNARLTAATPAVAPVTTGSRIRSSRRGERYTASSSADTRTTASQEMRVTSRLMAAREATANTPGPLTSKRAAGAASRRGHLREQLAQPLHSALLPVDVEARRARAHDQQRTLALAH